MKAKSDTPAEVVETGYSLGKSGMNEKVVNKSEIKPEKRGNLMYLGPTIIGAARHGTVFKDGILSKKVQECITELPALEKLFVEVDKVSESVRALRDEQSALRVIYEQAKVRFKE